MSDSWGLSDEKFRQALKKTQKILVEGAFQTKHFSEDDEDIKRAAEAKEMAVFELISKKNPGDQASTDALIKGAADAYCLMRVLPVPKDPFEAMTFLLRVGALAILGDKGADAARLLKKEDWTERSPGSNENWGEKARATIFDCWLRLIRKKGWEDRDAVLERISELRGLQTSYEKDFLEKHNPQRAKHLALELMVLYHLARAAEILALYITDGVVDGRHQIHQMLEMQFDRALGICRLTRMIELEPLCILLAAASAQMADNAIWTVTRAVNSKVTKFVQTLVDRGRDQPMFDMLPPQRRALAEKGLLGSSRRAVVVSLPTSSGKTLIAAFRILQALNQFEHEQGWVAYLAPTRALVNQITRRLRKDFQPLGVAVEQISPALEIDNIEASMMKQKTKPFRVLVTTPEKLDLMLRQDWETKIARPLTLVVVDEAHSIQEGERGLKLELLLATINNECRYAQFLLLTPFIPNGAEIARWLGGQNADDISLALEWQPNDRIIGIAQAEKGQKVGRSRSYHLKFEPVHTTKQTLYADSPTNIPKCEEIAKSYSQFNHPTEIAAVMAQHMQQRGPVLIIHGTTRWAWSLGKKLKIENNRKKPSENIRLVQHYLKAELGETFPLIDLLNYRIGIHHGGLSDEVRLLMEWLFENEELNFLVATTTIAQGMNFPVTGVVMASHQYPYGQVMSSEDFWNIAGRAGRIDQGKLGIVALVANDPSKAEKLRDFIKRETLNLNSALITMVRDTMDDIADLEKIVYKHPQWSAFLQYLAHAYRQAGKPEGFVDQIEQVLRGTLGFSMLRRENRKLSRQLMESIRHYVDYLQRPNQPLKLVDITGFSLSSVNQILAEANARGIGSSSWDGKRLFDKSDRNLQNMMGVLLKVPELREQLNAVTGGKDPDGKKLASILKDWVGGESIREIAKRYFAGETFDEEKAITKCGQNLFGKLTQTSAWGLGALLMATRSNLSEAEFKELSNLPSRVFYGVNSDSAVALRLLGIPRTAATLMADELPSRSEEKLADLRAQLHQKDGRFWQKALGEKDAALYQKIWRVLEGEY